MATFASSTFTGTALTTLSTLDSNFTVGTGAVGTFEVNNTGTSLYIKTGTTNYYHATAPAGADYTVTTTSLARDIAGYTVGPTARHDTASQTYYGARMDGGNGWRLIKVVSGTFTALGATARTFTAGNSYTVTLTVSSTSISLSAEGGAFTVGPVTDSSISAAGRPGIHGSFAESPSVGFCPSSWQADQAGGGGSSRPVKMAGEWGGFAGLSGGFAG